MNSFAQALSFFRLLTPVLICLVALSFWGCSSLLYYPTRALYVDPESLNPKPEEITFFIDQKLEQSLHGWLFRSHSPTKGVFVFFHGNGQNRSSHFRALYWVLDQGFDFFIFDYPGYGRSPGDPSPESTVLAGKRAIEFVQTNYTGKPIYVFAQSLGTVVALRALAELKDRKQICGAVLESAFDSYKLAARRALASHAVTWPFQLVPYLVLSDRYTIRGRHKELAPLAFLFLHQKEDPIIPFDLGQRLYNSTPEPKKFIALEGSGHVDALTRGESAFAREALIEFTKTSCLGTLPKSEAESKSRF